MKIIGHRGAKGLAPENTLKSFQKALEHKVDEIECDARVTGDGVVILEHDDLMQDHTGARHDVTSHTYQDLLGFKPELTSLDDAIKLVNKRVPLQVEIKPGVSPHPIFEVIDSFYKQGWTTNDLFVGSSDWKVLKAARLRFPDALLVVIESWSGIRAMHRCRKLRTKRISMSAWSMWPGYIRAVKNSGYEICAYTMNNPAKVRRWRKYGLHGIFTDYPDLYQK